MLAIERQNIIKNIILEKKGISVSEMAEHFGVSFETIRRDFKTLENDGFIEKTYGGAVLRQRVQNTADFKMLENIMVDTKDRLAAIAKKFIVTGDCIYVDFSTTCLRIAKLLDDIPLNVMSNSLKVLNVLSNKENISLFSTAGFWDSKNCSFMGRIAINCLEQFHFDKAFISCRAVSMESGLSDKTEQEADIRKKIIECANKVYLVVDHTKFNKTAFVRTAGFEKITAIITDKPANEQWGEFIAENNIKWFDFETAFDEIENDSEYDNYVELTTK